MFRVAISRISGATSRALTSNLPNSIKPQVYAVAGVGQNLLPRRLIGSEIETEPDEVFDARWEAFFKNDNLDRNTYRRGLDELFGYDLVPEPKILNAAFRAARRLNDVAIPVRILEVVRDKAGSNKEIYPYILEQTREVRDELGISTPEELGIDTA